MRHKSDSTSLGKIIHKFTPDRHSKNLIAISRDPCLETSKLLYLSHFDLLIFQLTSKTLTKDLILQKIQSNTKPFLHICSYSKPDFSISSQPLSSKYLINGKYLNEEIDTKEVSFSSTVLKSLSEEILKFLNATQGSILSCAFEFLEDDLGYYLIDILNVTEGVMLAGKRISRCVSENIPAAKPPSRPVTARSINKSFHFTHQETSVSTYRNVTTPRSFKLSYEFPSKCVQTTHQDCCENFTYIEKVKLLVEDAEKRRESLRIQLEEVDLKNKKEAQELEEKWKKKCLDLSQSIADRKIEQARRSVSRGKGKKRVIL
jgi:hypothetical protein